MATTMHSLFPSFYCLAVLLFLMVTLHWTLTTKQLSYVIVVSVTPKQDDAAATLSKLPKVPDHLMHHQQQHVNASSSSSTYKTPSSPLTLSSWPKGAFWNQHHQRRCRQWGVTIVTSTTSTSNSAVQQLAALEDWCVVVVVGYDDKNSARRSFYQPPSSEVVVVYLSQARQKELARYLPFVKEVMTAKTASSDHPSQLSQKNIGYLYAIANGAQFIWDFDEHTTLLPGVTLSRYTATGAARTSTTRKVAAGQLEGMLPSTSTVLQTELRNSTACGVFNPYPIFRPINSDVTFWPRGYPLEKMEATECRLTPRYRTHEIPLHQIGIYQSVIHQNPDLYQYHRMTQHALPVRFNGALEDYPVLVPKDTLSPMNAQASLVSRKAMWSLFLPSTILDEVADIWRSYATQTLARHLDMWASFVGPLASREHPNHTNWEALYHEHGLYESSGNLVSFLLNSWQINNHSATTTPVTLESAMEKMYAELYQQGYIEWNDVRLAQLWISSLQSVGYEFPQLHSNPTHHLITASVDDSSSKIVKSSKWKWTRERFDDVVLVGQFNFNTDERLVVHWVKRWREIFTHVDVRGPFDNDTLDSLRRAGINAFVIEDDRGWLSPMTTMADSLLLYANHSNIRGVIMAHDDLLFNMSQMVELGFPSDSVMGNFDPSYLLKPYLVVYPNGTLRREDNSTLVAVTNWNEVLPFWRWWKVLARKLARAAVAAANSNWKYLDADGGISFHHNSQADFLYMPTTRRDLIDEFAALAGWMSQHKVMLEVGTPTILGKLHQTFNISFTEIPICTDWTVDRDNITKWLPACSSTLPDSQYGTYHPVKMFNLGLKKWNALFDALVLGIGDTKEVLEDPPNSYNFTDDIQLFPPALTRQNSYQ